MLKAVGFISASVFALSALLIGARFFVRGVRSSSTWPERLVGVGFLLIGLGYAALVSAAIAGNGRPAPLPLLIALAVLDAGFIAIGLFCWYVFHRGSRLGSVVAAVLVFGSVLTAAASPWIPAFPDGTPGAAPVRMFLRFTIFVWSAFASLGYYTQMKRRLAIGLADPLVTDRFRLWGLFMSSAAVLLVALTVGGILRLRDHFLAPIFNIIGLLVGWFCIGLFWFSFTPPKWYNDRVIARAPKPEDP